MRFLRTHSKEASQKANPIGLWFLHRLFWATDHFSLTEEVRLTMCNKIVHNKKKRKFESMAIGSNSDESVASEKSNADQLSTLPKSAVRLITINLLNNWQF
jgi:hypothetical protein